MTSPQELTLPANIGIIGYGIVGQAIAYGFSKASHSRDVIRYYDKYKDTLSLAEVVEKSEFIFVALPTPMKKDESGIDLSIFDAVMDEITQYTDNTQKIIIIKSTIVPGTVARYEKTYPKSFFAFSPEFLTETNFLDDFLYAPRTIIGVNNEEVFSRVAELFEERFTETQIYRTDPTTAETVKYFANSFLSLKVVFANIFYELSEELGINYEEVKRLATTDPRIGESHLSITTQRGFGGKCFPKDMVAILGRAKELGVDFAVLEKAWEYNKKIRKIHDWEDIPFAVQGNSSSK